jgi:hypothetical protein
VKKLTLCCRLGFAPATNGHGFGTLTKLSVSLPNLTSRADQEKNIEQKKNTHTHNSEQAVLGFSVYVVGTWSKFKRVCLAMATA